MCRAGSLKRGVLVARGREQSEVRLRLLREIEDGRIGLACLVATSHRGVRTPQAEIRQRIDRRDRIDTDMVDHLLKRSQGVRPCVETQALQPSDVLWRADEASATSPLVTCVP